MTRFLAGVLTGILATLTFGWWLSAHRELTWEAE